jgi:hypothetical protein
VFRRAKAIGGAFALLLAVAPVLVAAITITQTDIPRGQPLLGALASPINPWIDDLPLSLIPAVILGIAGWLVAFMPTRTEVKSSSVLVRAVVVGVLACLAIVLLWLGIVFTHLWIVLKYWYAPMIGFPTPRSWVLLQGAGWTGGIILFVFLKLTDSSRPKGSHIAP